METANEGMTIKFAAKTASLDEDWKVAFATKKGDHFEVFFEENTEEKYIFKFEDETKSLLSANLWEMGWYSLLQDERARDDCESDISKEKPREVSEKNCDAIEFKGKSFTTPNCELFESVVLSRGLTEATFSTKDKVLFQSQECVFFLAVRPTGDEQPQAVVFRFNPDTPALVPISELVCNENVGDIDPQQFAIMKHEVDKFIKARLLLSSSDGRNHEQNNGTGKSECAKQIETIEIANETSGCGKGSEKRTTRRKLKQPFSPNQDQIIHKNKLRDSRGKSQKQKARRHSKQPPESAKRACVLDKKPVVQATCVHKAPKEKQTNKKSDQKHDGSSLEMKIDTVLNAVGEMQAQLQIDVLKRAASNHSTNLQNNDANMVLQNLLPIHAPFSSFQQVPFAAGPAQQGRSEVSEVLQAVKVMAAVTYMQSMHSFFR